ncbi:MAG TPA: HAMP domain-containing sensor histidine kinase [Methylomirabilota bacterium]|nr:HAMP domain-containing sensor histidine kinase [Methylomirabilota bacterium]
MLVRLGRLKIRQKLQLGFGTLILLIGILAVVTVHNNLDVRRNYQLLAQDAFPAVRTMGLAELKGARVVESTSELADMLVAAHRRLLIADPGGAYDTQTLIASLPAGDFDDMKVEIRDQQEGLRHFLREFSNVQDRVHGVGMIAEDRVALQERDRVVALGNAVLQASKDVVALIDARADLDSILAAQERMTGTDPEFFSTIEAKITTTNAAIAEHSNITEGLIDRSTETLLSCAALALVLGLGVGLFLADRIATPIALLREAAVRLGAGDFSAGEVAAKIKSSDEVGDLAGAFAKMAADLESANAKLARNQRLSMLGQVAGTVSHELRNPLGAIRTSLAVFKKLCADKGLGIERSLERAERSVGRCDGIISDLLEYTRSREMARQPVDFDKLIGEQLDEHALPTAVAVKRELSGGCTVAVDRDRFRQVLINLLDNAAQAMTDPGWTPPEGRERTITVRTEAAGPHCRLSVIDSGPGIPEPARAKIFEPLFTTKNFGVGLGLPTVQKIVEAHGGTIDVERTGPEGTTFVVWLPRQQAGQDTIAETQPAAAHAAA